ncbi:hypothetical protein BDA96_10G228500 [Sorghum bicolor]|uniref:Uncharacterized protein n=2 Tax=Sorghum bicolor TaxID=4558 RepID=A0A921Q414_SORBI|nr:hypothetical protein BDA96_10G228500 [Sorghum bicolor]KXG20229.1 hypothetical protein SORBI_3010G173300 [Sorghum bicolor]
MLDDKPADFWSDSAAPRLSNLHAQRKHIYIVERSRLDSSLSRRSISGCKGQDRTRQGLSCAVGAAKLPLCLCIDRFGPISLLFGRASVPIKGQITRGEARATSRPADFGRTLLGAYGYGLRHAAGRAVALRIRFTVLYLLVVSRKQRIG